MTIKARIPAVGAHPLADLLFSPSAAFVWDADRAAVTWMNRAARAKYERTTAELTAALSKATRLRLTGLSAQEPLHGKPLRLSLKVAKLSPAKCSIEPLKIAGGHKGLIVAEAEPQMQDGPPAKDQSKPISNKKTASRSAGAERGGTKGNGPPIYCSVRPELTEDELRAFRAIGRKVRKLCREKLRDKEAVAEPERPTPLAPIERPEAGVESAASALLNAILPSFDLFLILDRSFRVLKVEGRSHRLGWRKSALRGMAIADLLPSSERGNLDKMTSKTASTRRTSREHLLAQTSAGAIVPCRAILGPWPFERAAFFLALISLSLTPRLKRLDFDPEPRLQTASLAA